MWGYFQKLQDYGFPRTRKAVEAITAKLQATKSVPNTAAWPMRDAVKVSMTQLPHYYTDVSNHDNRIMLCGRISASADLIRKAENRNYRPVWHVNLAQFPANCGTMIVSEMLTYSPFTKLRIGTAVQQSLTDIASVLGFSTMVCTTNGTSPHHERMMLTDGWAVAYEFRNSRSNRDCKFWHKEVH